MCIARTAARRRRQFKLDRRYTQWNRDPERSTRDLMAKVQAEKLRRERKATTK